MLLSSQYLVQTVWFQLREWRKNGLEVLKLNISKGPVSRPPLSGSDCLNLVLDFGTTLHFREFFSDFEFKDNYILGRIVRIEYDIKSVLSFLTTRRCCIPGYPA